MRELSPTKETITSLRGRGLLSADAYNLHLAALGLGPDGWPLKRSLLLQPLAVLVALVGCLFGILGAFFRSFRPISCPALSFFSGRSSRRH